MFSFDVVLLGLDSLDRLVEVNRLVVVPGESSVAYSYALIDRVTVNAIVST